MGARVSKYNYKHFERQFELRSEKNCGSFTSSSIQVAINSSRALFATAQFSLVVFAADADAAADSDSDAIVVDIVYRIVFLMVNSFYCTSRSV